MKKFFCILFVLSLLTSFPVSAADSDTPITRAEFAELTVHYLAKQYRVEVHDIFSLCSDEDRERDEDGYILPYYADAENIYADALYSFGVMNGRGNGIFDPDTPITREEAAKVLCKTYQLYADCAAVVTNTDLPYTDADDIAGWADTIPYEVLLGMSARVKRVYTE